MKLAAKLSVSGSINYGDVCRCRRWTAATSTLIE